MYELCLDKSYGPEGLHLELVGYCYITRNNAANSQISYTFGVNFPFFLGSDDSDSVVVSGTTYRDH